MKNFTIIMIIICICSFVFAADNEKVKNKKKTFCFMHKETSAIIYDCEENKGPNDSFSKIYCKDRTGKIFRFKPIDDWKRIEGDVCSLPMEKYDEIPKGATTIR